MKIKPRLIIGLGNPGKKYEKTYHNVGFLAIDFLTKNSPIPKPLKSNVYMNLSGNFVRLALKKYKAKPEELLVVHDDSDIALGDYKISFNRGAAGHKGIESIIKHLGTKKFYRLRIGVQPQEFRIRAEKIVLKKIKPQELKILNKVFEESLINLKGDIESN